MTLTFTLTFLLIAGVVPVGGGSDALVKPQSGESRDRAL